MLLTSPMFLRTYPRSEPAGLSALHIELLILNNNRGIIGDNQVVCQLTVKAKANVSSQLNFRLFVSCQLKFWPFVRCQLTPFRPSFMPSLAEDVYTF